jgi:hypothetical protein
VRGAVAASLLAASLLPRAALAQERSKNPRTDYTAYTRPAGRTAVGPFKIELGIFDEVMVGTYVPPWFAYPAIGVLVPSAYLKLRSWWSGPFVMAVRGGFTYIGSKGIEELSDGQTSASAGIYAVELDSSLRISPTFTLHLAGDYNHVQAIGDADELANSIEGATTADTWSARLMAELQLSHSFLLNLMVRYLIYQSPVNADVSTDSPSTSVEGDLSGEGTRPRRLTVEPGLSYEGEHWELQLGVGYGVFYLPVVGLPTAKSLPVVDLAFAYSFDLY